MTVLLVAKEYETPFGELSVLVTPADGVVRASGFRRVADLAMGMAHPPSGRDWEFGDMPQVDDVLGRWLAGDGDALRDVPVEQPGGPFFQEVWRAMREIPGGTTISYQELAADAGRPRAMRAAGTACARNGVSPFVPAHRVVKSGGQLGRYGRDGEGLKAALLAHERPAVAGL